MRRIIVHLIRGEAKTFHEAITKDLAEKFDSYPMHEKIVPHLTIKRWFELDESGMGSVYTTLDDFQATHTQSDYLFRGFNHFEEKVIYVDVKASKEMLLSTRDLMKELRKVGGLVFDEFDEIEDDMHASVAIQAWKPFDYERIWNYLSDGEQPDFEMKFDNVTIMKKEEDKWIVERIWELPA